MRPALASSPHQARSLQGLLHPGVTQFDPVLGLQLLVKMLHVQIEILSRYKANTFSTVVTGTRRREGLPRRRSSNPL